MSSPGNATRAYLLTTICFFCRTCLLHGTVALEVVMCGKGSSGIDLSLGTRGRARALTRTWFYLFWQSSSSSLARSVADRGQHQCVLNVESIHN